MSEHARRNHDRSSDVHSDQYYDDPNYRESYDYHDARDYRDEYVEYDQYQTEASYHQSADYDHSASDDYSYHDETITYATDDQYNYEHPEYVEEYDQQDSANAVHYPGAEFLTDYQPGDRIEPDFSGADIADEGVWLKEKHNRITYNDSDLRDFGPTARRGSLGTTMAGFAGVAAMLALIGFLAISSAPDLSPEEIIAMEGYAGEQQIKTPFNLASLRDCEASEDCIDSAKDITAITAGTTDGTTTTETISSITTNEVATNEVATNELATNEVTTFTTEAEVADGYTVIREIPAANITTFDSLETGGHYATANEEMVVLQQWSNVRGQPERNGDILTSLAEGTIVTKIGQTGQWVEVAVNGRQLVTGYMHSSTVAQR